MKKIIFILTTLVLTISVSGQISTLTPNLKTIEIQGLSTKIIYPDYFKVLLYLKEETHRNSEGKIVKDSLEIIEKHLFKKIKELGFSEKQLNLQSFESQTLIYSKERKILEGKIYEIEIDDKKDVLLIFKELRFEGLEGIEVLNLYGDLQNVENELYHQALKDAKEKAKTLLKELGYVIDEVNEISIELMPESFLRTYPYNGHIWYNSNKPKFKFNDQPKLLRAIVKAKFTYK